MPKPENVDGLLALIRKLDEEAMAGPWVQRYDRVQSAPIYHEGARADVARVLGGKGNERWVIESRTLLPRCAEVIEEMLELIRRGKTCASSAGLRGWAVEAEVLLAGKEKL